MTPLTLLTPAADFLNRLRERGVSVSLRPDGKLWLKPKAALTPDLLAEAKTRRDELVALLAGQNVEAAAPSSAAPAALDRADEAGGLSEAECRRIAARVGQVLAGENEATAARWRRLRQPDDSFNLNADAPPGADPSWSDVRNETVAPSPSDPTAVAARADELLAAAEHNPVIRIADRERALDYYRGRAALEFTQKVPGATVHRLRPTAWADARDEPQPGDRCQCCRGSAWWIEGGPVKRGWRCNRCHPPPVPFGLRRLCT